MNVELKGVKMRIFPIQQRCTLWDLGFWGGRLERRRQQLPKMKIFHSLYNITIPFLIKKRLSGYKNTSGVNCISSKKMILHRVVVVVVVQEEALIYISYTGVVASVHSGIKYRKKCNLESHTVCFKS